MNTLRPYTPEQLLAAIARHATSRGLEMDLAYRTRTPAPAELLVAADQFDAMIAELARRDECSADGTELFMEARS